MENLKDGVVHKKDPVFKKVLLFVDNKHIVSIFIGRHNPYRMFHLGIRGLEFWSKRTWRGYKGVFPHLADPVSSNSIDAVNIRMEAVIGELIGYIQDDDGTAGQTNGKTSDIDERIDLLSFDLS